MTTPTQHPASTSDARKRAADLATPDWGSDLREPLDLDAIRARAEAFDEAWGWREQTDDMLAGRGHHMTQMLYRLPVDGQTSDMRASIEGMLTDVPALLAEVERLAHWKAEALPVLAGLQELGKALGLPLGERITGQRAAEAAIALLARAEKTEAERDAAWEALARVEALVSFRLECTQHGAALARRCSQCERVGVVNEYDRTLRAALAQPATDEKAVYCRRCDFYTDHVSTAHDGLAARGLLRAKGEGLVVCADCGHTHTPDQCIGDSTPSDHWAGVTPASCDCPGPGATDEGAGACTCGHPKSDHRHGAGECLERDRYLPCGCKTYEARP